MKWSNTTYKSKVILSNLAYGPAKVAALSAMIVSTMPLDLIANPDGAEVMVYF